MDYRKTNLTEDQWVDFDHDFFQTAKNKLPFPHLLNAKSFAQHLNDAYWVTYDKHMPKKMRKINPKSKSDRPWITAGLKASITKKYELLHTSKQTGCL